MKKVNENLARLEDIFDAAIINYPHNQEVIKAFKPVIMKCRSLIETLRIPGNETCTLDEERFKAGESLSRHNDLLVDVPWDSIIKELIPALSEGFASLRDDLNKLDAFILKYSNSFTEVMQGSASEQPAQIEKIAAKAGINPQIIELVFRTAMHIVLAQQAQAWKELIAGFSWDKGSCPICGASPMIASIEEGIPRRWLHCSRCLHAWEFSRVICPACANTDQRAMTYFSVEGSDHDSTFTCEACHSYLITVNKVGDLAQFDAEVAALSLIHLDVLMQEKGYTPMAETAWNVLK
jgi:FdhE protein